MQGKLENPEQVREFALAGNATITLQSEKTGNHFTYKIRQAEDRETGKLTQRWFVSLLGGPDNESDFIYLGLLDMGNWRTNYLDPAGPIQFRQTAKSCVASDRPSVMGFQYFWRAIAANSMPRQMAVFHEGRCGRCGRKLTTPDSVQRGIGPECAEKMGFMTIRHELSAEELGL
ncbi:MAG TPA: DUF6011 domain-containing protein [Nitrospira sp.]|nr:DUF6011 domain-containing protein [Nitrospira sp.]